MKKILAMTLMVVMILTSVICSTAFVGYADTVILSDSFDGGTTDYDYTLYDTTVDAAVSATAYGKNDSGEYDVPALQYKGTDYEGNANGGWKLDITSLVTSGTKLGISFDHLTDYYDAKVFIEVRNASGTAVNTFDFSDAPKTSEAWASYTSAIQPTISFTSGQKVYLCVKQESGYWFIDNIALSSIGSTGGSTGGNTGSDTTTTSVIFSDDFAGGTTDYDYTLYDTTVDAEVKATSSGKNNEGEYDVECIEYKGADYEGSTDGGWKVDITNYVTSGTKLGLSFDHLTDYYDAKVFIEVRDASGTAVNTFDFSDAPKTSEAWASYTSTVQPTISFTLGQTVYLCVKQESGFWHVTNIALSSIDSGTDSGDEGDDEGGESQVPESGSKNILPSDEDITVDDLTWEIYKKVTDTTTSTVSGAKIVKDTAKHTVTFTKYNNNFSGKADITDMFSGMKKLKKITLSFHYANTRDGSYAGILILDSYGSTLYKTAHKDLQNVEKDYTETITDEISINSGSKIYLYASPTKNGNIVLSDLTLDVDYESGGPADVDEGWTSVIRSDFSDSATAPAFEPYDTSVKADILVKNTCPDGNGEYNVTGLEYVGYDDEGNDYTGHENGGVKISITDKIKNGDQLSLSLKYRTEYYEFVPFIEVRSSKGVVKNTYAFDIAEKSETWVNYKSEAMPTVNFTTGDIVYFCIKCQNGFWHFSNLTLATSGTGEEVEAVDVGEKTIINESFAGGSSSSSWVVYDSSVDAAVTLTSYGPDGGEGGGYNTPSLQYKESSYASDERAGVKTEITSLVKKYDTLKLSMDYRSEWYDVHPFVEVVGTDGTVKGTFPFSSGAKGGENCGWSSYRSVINPEISFESTDKVYLCVKSAGGYWHLKNVVLTRSAYTGIKWSRVLLKKDNAIENQLPDGAFQIEASVFNYGYDEGDVVTFVACIYSGDTLKSVEIKDATLPARNTGGTTIDITNEGGNILKLFVWDIDTLDELEAPVVK